MGVGCNGGSDFCRPKRTESYRRSRNRAQNKDLPAMRAFIRPKSRFFRGTKPARNDERLTNSAKLARRSTGALRRLDGSRRLPTPRELELSAKLRLPPGCQGQQRSLPPGLARGPQTHREAAPKQKDDRPLEPRPHGRAPPRRAAVDGGGLLEARRRAAHDARHSQSVVGGQHLGQWIERLRLKICETGPARP